MKLTDFKKKIPPATYQEIAKTKIKELRPCQEKAINAELFNKKNLLICTPTASGKTLVAEMAIHHTITNNKGKALYIVPLKALANEKFNHFSNTYTFKTAVTSSDFDSADSYLEHTDLIISTSEKFDSLLRHKVEWIKTIQTIVIDEIHLLNDAHRGPTLEILITLLRTYLNNPQIIGLSATIGNPEELASWLNANLIQDSWRPVTLHQGIYHDGAIQFYENKKKRS
ncbi:hypothetical protein CMO92_00920 [Candidatus Woesearchaeota archaeon]|nr:hypothetical protein [Candidatus Woesearchaeota archaeon]